MLRKHWSIKVSLKSYIKNTKYNENNTLTFNITFNFTPLNFYLRITLKRFNFLSLAVSYRSGVLTANESRYVRFY